MRATGVAAVMGAVLVAGCGGGDPRQDAGEPAHTYDVQVVKASFPVKQTLAESVEMRVRVRNTGSQTIPNIAVTLTDDAASGGFTTRSEQQGLQDPTKQLWIVDQAPRGGDTAYVSTWALGPLPAGRTRSFVWHVTPVVPGAHTVRFRVAAGLNGKARAETKGGDEPGGVFKVDVSRKPPQGHVDLVSGEVTAS
ncbi:MAG TPA: hypothetical protein VFT50_04495 [Baekduia sp.]|nr:hypothetical protein [Baekduia sp.]